MPLSPPDYELVFELINEIIDCVLVFISEIGLIKSIEQLVQGIHLTREDVDWKPDLYH
jgi:hypothetical protein